MVIVFWTKLDGDVNNGEGVLYGCFHGGQCALLSRPLHKGTTKAPQPVLGIVCSTAPWSAISDCGLKSKRAMYAGNGAPGYKQERAYQISVHRGRHFRGLHFFSLASSTVTNLIVAGIAYFYVPIAPSATVQKMGKVAK